MAFLERLLAPSAQKAVVGPGAHSMTWNPPIMDERDRDQRVFIKKALGTYHASRHIKRAEMTIANRIGGIPWHLEDPDGEEITDESPENLRNIRDLIEKPTQGKRVGNQPVTRRELWGITARHMGLVNVAFWYLDEIDRMTRWPKRILYIRPDRMTPATSDDGSLVGWVLDQNGDRKGTGTPLELDEVLTFYLDPPDEGFYGSGLVEAALSLAQKVRLSDGHEIGVLGSGGRLAGLFAPKTGETVNDEVFDRMVRDLRTITDMPDAAKRSIVARAPVDFTPTSANMNQLLTAELSKLTQEQTFGLWGVPPATAGYAAPVGLNSGVSRDADEAALYQNAIQPRLDAMYEVIQYAFLDRLDPLGINLQLILEVPTFDDDMPKFDMANKAANQPLSVDQRLELLGLPPVGGDLGRTIFLPIGMVAVGQTPDDVNPSAKAKITNLRPAIEKLAPRLRRDLTAFLDEQRHEIATKVRARASHLSRKPSDVDAWWSPKWDRQLEKVLAPYAQTVADMTAEQAQRALRPGKAGFDDLVGNRVLQRLLTTVGKRVKGINDTTREAISQAIREGIEAGEGAAQLGDRIEAAAIFDEYRAELIARTETATVLNTAATESYREFGVSQVDVIDGDEDDICASANGQRWSLDEANDNPIGHPNCTRDFLPVIA